MMNYHAIHGHDVEGFGTPLTHRVLTVSAADADAALLSQSSASSTMSGPTAPVRLVATGIPGLDSILSGSPDADMNRAAAPGDGSDRANDSNVQAPPAGTQHRPSGGLRRGQLTEIWGPPGAGTTTLGMQLTANALRSGSSVVWVDCFHSLSGERLAAVVNAQTQDNADVGAKSIEQGFAHHMCLSLPHFLAMFCPPPTDPAADVPADASVMVIDSLSALVNYALPRTVDQKGTPLMANGKKGPTSHEKRTQVLQYIVAALERLAETRNMAVVLLTQCASRMQAENGAALVPAINADVWDRGIATRLVLFRDWAWENDKPVGGHFAGVQKLNRTASDSSLSHAVAFAITEIGLVEEQFNVVPSRATARALKRKLGEAGLEVESDEENYGWDDDDSMPNMPPQWQGSEDLLLGHRYGDSDEEEQDEEQKDEEQGTEQQSEKDGEKATPRRSPHSVADSEDDSDM